jgi:hypothetical protein
MTRAHIFMGPGEWLVRFALSLIDLSATDLSPELFKALSVVVTLVFWFQVGKIVVAVVRRITGFDRQGPQR